MPADERDPVARAVNAGWDERVIVCHCGNTVDAFVVVTSRYVILVDTLLNPETATGMLAIATPHLRDGRTLLVIDTHADWDHCWGNQLFSGNDAIHPAPIVATRRCAERLASPEAHETLARLSAEDAQRFAEVRITPPTLLFDNRLTIDGGDLTLELFATPGHTPDHLSIYIPQLRLLLAGDAAEEPFPFVSTTAVLPDLRASLHAMAALHPAWALYCHAPVTAGPELLARNIEYFDRLEIACRAALARGIGPEPRDDALLEAAIGFSYDVAVAGRPESVASGWDYREGHRKAIRLMLAWLSATSA